MEIFSDIFDKIINPIFAQPSFILGAVTLVGLIALKKPFAELIKGTTKTIIGVLLLQNGSGLMVSMFRPIIFGFTERFQIAGVIIDPYITLSAVTDALGEKLGWVGFTMLIGFGGQYPVGCFLQVHPSAFSIPDRACHVFTICIDHMDRLLLFWF